MSEREIARALLETRREWYAENPTERERGDREFQTFLHMLGNEPGLQAWVRFELEAAGEVLVRRRHERAPARVPVGRCRAVVIRAGQSVNGHTYPEAVLETAVALFANAPVFLGHGPRHVGARPRGYLTAPTWVPDRGELHATLVVLDARLWRDIVRAHRADRVTDMGLSICAEVRQGPGRVVSWITSVESVDIVEFPAAGGYILCPLATNEKLSAPQGAIKSRQSR